MKKILTSIFILLSFFLISCSNEGELGLDIKKETIQSENKNIIQKNIDNIDEKKINKIEKIEEIGEISNNKELIKHKDGNIYLYENGKQIDYLTTKAGKTWDKNEFPYGTIEYEIKNAKGKYGVVTKFFNSNAGIGWDTYYIINLNNFQKSYEMKELPPIEGGDFYKLNGDFIEFGIEDYFILNGPDDKKDCYNACRYKNEIIKEGYKKQGNIWIKKIDLSKIDPDILDNNISKKKIKKM